MNPTLAAVTLADIQKLRDRFHSWKDYKDEGGIERRVSALSNRLDALLDVLEGVPTPGLYGKDFEATEEKARAEVRSALTSPAGPLSSVGNLGGPIPSSTVRTLEEAATKRAERAEAMLSKVRDTLRFYAAPPNYQSGQLQYNVLSGGAIGIPAPTFVPDLACTPPVAADFGSRAVTMLREVDAFFGIATEWPTKL